jgi:hypothetical protein
MHRESTRAFSCRVPPWCRTGRSYCALPWGGWCGSNKPAVNKIKARAARVDLSGRDWLKSHTVT